MHRWSWSLLILIALIACGGCGSDGADASAAGGALDEETRRQLEAELVQADREFARAVERHGLGAWLATFTPTGRLVVRGRSHVGREGIRRALLPLYADSGFSVTWDPSSAEVARSGDFGYTVGRYERTTAERDAAEPEGSGTYLTAWRRQADGAWKAQMHIGSPRDGD